jgi:hypothetical protein
MASIEREFFVAWIYFDLVGGPGEVPDVNKGK